MIGGRHGQYRTASSVLITIVILGAWVIERWGPGLIPADWSFGSTGRLCTLNRVVDGDSLQLVCAGETREVRLYCIDAPETAQRPWGKRALANLRKIATREVEMREIETDRFGRTVAEVYTSGEPRLSLNVEQVRLGQAAVYPRYCEESRFFRAERTARDASLGIWASPGAHQTPWDFRQRR